MEALLAQNLTCADCSRPSIHSVNMQFGVFVCELCSIAHQVLRFPMRALSSSFSAEETDSLHSEGNEKVNSALLLYVPPWIATPLVYDIDFVRLFYIESKYTHMSFADDLLKKYRSFDLNQYWFYLDETTRDTPVVRGPKSRENILSLVEDSELSLEYYIWHPVLGKKWLVLERMIEVLKPPSSISDSKIYQACHKKLALLEIPYPHLKGYVQITFKLRTFTRWLVLLDRKLAVFTQNIAGSPEYEVPILGLEIYLRAQGQDFYLEIVSEDDQWIITSTPPEIIEWYHAVKCAHHLLQTLNEDLSPFSIDSTELHICNVKNSKDYVGDKVIEGNLRKEGSIWKRKHTRWFVLRKMGLFYFLSPKDKECKGELRLTADTKVEMQETYKDNYHFCVIAREKIIHLWANTEDERNYWVSALHNVISETSGGASIS